MRLFTYFNSSRLAAESHAAGHRGALMDPVKDARFLHVNFFKGSILMRVPAACMHVGGLQWNRGTK